MTISLARDFRVIPTVNTPTGTGITALGLFVTEEDILTLDDSVSFENAQSVANYFGADSLEYSVANQYFKGYDNCTQLPARVFFARYDVMPSIGWQKSLKISLTLTQLKALKGDLAVNVDGNLINTPEIDLSAATSFDSAAGIIETAIGTAVTVSWLSVQKQFIIKSATPGENSSVKVIGGTIQDSLGFSYNSEVSHGRNGESPTELMNRIISKNQSWVGFSVFGMIPDKEFLEFASWTSSQNQRYIYVICDGTEDALSQNSTTCLSYLIKQQGYAPVYCVAGSPEDAASQLGYMAALNFDAANGRVTAKFRSFSGLEPYITNDQDAANAQQNGYSYYGAYSLNNTKTNYWSDGAITGSFKWVDSLIGNIWLNGDLVAGFVNLFKQNVSAPFNEDGYSLVRSVADNTAQKGLNFGAIRKGVELDQSQIQVIMMQAGGKDISKELYSQGYYFYIPNQSSTSRLNRALDGAIFFYCDGQAIQSIVMSSEDIL